MTRAARASVAVLASGLALLACRDFDEAYRTYCGFSDCADGGGDGGRSDGGLDAGPTVTLTVVDHYITGRGVVDVAVDSGVAAQSFDGGALPVTYLGNGVFQVSTEPGTPFLALRTPPGYDHPLVTVTSLGALDLGQYDLGRPAVAAAGANTLLVIDAGGMVSWNDNDVIELSCAGAGIGGEFLYIPNYTPPADNPPVPGDTTLSIGIHWDQYSPNPLIDVNQGDQTIVYQLADTFTDAGVEYTRIAAWIDSFDGPGLTLADGQTTLLQGSFSALPSDHSADFSYDRLAFANVTPAQPAGAVVSGGETLFVEAIYGGFKYGNYGQMPDVAVAFLDGGTTTVRESLSFGSPFPASWSLAVLAGQLSRTPFNLTDPVGSTISAVEETQISITVPFDAGATNIAPLVAPPTSLQINGSIADSQPIPPVGLAPQVSWSAGALAAPTYYIVALHELTASASTPTSIASFLTADTTLPIPPGYLQPMHVYELRLTAVYDPNGGWPTRPLEGGIPYGEAQAVTRWFTP